MELNRSVLDFLSELHKNNNREWFAQHKDEYESAKNTALQFFSSVYEQLSETDAFSSFKMYRIYRDVRFSADKSPYKDHFGCIFMRQQPQNRGSFYIHLKPQESFIGGGFWSPNTADLLKIRQAIDYENNLESILKSTQVKKTFGGLWGEQVKTTPKGFDKNHPRIELIRYKQFLLKHDLTDADILNKRFEKQVVDIYKNMLPFYQYMTEVLTTDANGESI